MSEPRAKPGTRGRGRPSTGARQAIRAAARELLEEGMGSFTTRQVARRAGVSEASVFYHFQDKAALLQDVVLAGLEPVKALANDQLTDAPDRPSTAALLPLVSALEDFFDQAMPALAAVQSDPTLRDAFAQRLVAGDLGPHRGVSLLARHLGSRPAIELTDPEIHAAAFMLVAACFLRAWQRQLAGPGREETLPSLDDAVRVIDRLIAPPEAPQNAPWGRR